MSTGFFKSATRPEREPSRPKFVNPKTGEMQSWQRASNFAAPLDSGFGMVKHKTRQLVRGFNRRLDLARMLLTGAVIEDKIDEVIETALTAAEDEAKANNGTAVHAALQLCDTGADVPEEYWPHARAYVAELKRHGLRPVAVEQRILNTRLDATGTFDRVYVTDSGRYLIGDIKSGSLKYPHGYAVQCEVYAGGDYLVHETHVAGRPDIEPIPWKLDQDAALIVHVDPDSGATSIYEVPLHVARWGAALAEQVRAFQRTDVLLPYSGAPAGPLAEELRREAVQQAARAADVPAEYLAEAQQPEESQREASALHHTQTSATEPAVRSAPLGSSMTQTAPSEASAPTASPSDLEARMEELMKTSNTKPKLQQMLRGLGWNPSDLAHNRKWLAAKIIEIETSNAGARAARPNGAAAAVAQTVEQDVPRGEATPFMLKQLADAPSTADIERIRANVIAQSGAAAWTPAMEEVARVRVAELQPQTSPLSRIADAKSKQDIAQIWSDVTGDGATPSAWTPAYESAAVQRAATFAATPPVNPNPWGSQ